MVAFFAQFNPIIQALLGTTFTWGVTALGAASVFLSKEVNRKLLDGMLGFAAGVMIAASFWSLLEPSIQFSISLGLPAYLPPTVGFLLGGIVLSGIDHLLPHLHMGLPTSSAEGIKTSWHRSILLVLAITLHNIPEGMAVGVAFGAAAAGVRELRSPAVSRWRWASGSKTFRKDWLWPRLCVVKDLHVSRASGTDSFPAWSNRSAPHRCRRGRIHAPYSTVCAGVRSRCHDLRGDRGIDPGGRTGAEHGYCHSRSHDRIRINDGAGCCFRIKSLQYEKSHEAL
jgi:hypothetical protein